MSDGGWIRPSKRIEFASQNGNDALVWGVTRE